MSALGLRGTGASLAVNRLESVPPFGTRTQSEIGRRRSEADTARAIRLTSAHQLRPQGEAAASTP